MMKFYFLVLTVIIGAQVGFSQPAPLNRQQFFLDDSVIEVHLTTDVKKLRATKKTPVWQPAHIVMNFGDTLVVEGDINVEQRGQFRKQNCDMASLMLNFNTPGAPKLAGLKKLKLVGGCQGNFSSEQLLLKEYLVYKIYNILSVMSFRVRLLHIMYDDSKQKAKPYTQYAFFIEDMKDMAARNNCREVKGKTFATEATNRQQITFVSIFQYMIGNTDWSIPNYHNVKLMVPLTDTVARPYPIPYDFDYCGLVDAPYAVPNDGLDITSVRDRYYRGSGRSMEELEPIIAVFNEKEATIMQRVNSFYLLKPNERKTVAMYLEQFFEKIKDKSDIRYMFINNALKR